EGPFTLVHSSLQHPERFEYLMDLAQALDSMRACRMLMCLAGHTHLPCVIEYDRTRRRVERILTAPAELTDVTFRDDADGLRYLVNPGSVGQPRDGDPRAGFAVIDTERRMLRVHRVRYDVETAARKIRQAGLPEFLADRLAIGR
ncbi:MAG: metallophosphoesterase family protein, partial [Candidatus Omnitrophica bacterium]|nr:metallophosphoesterase family protein [Candidatus Omnitrophota bacterium]